MELKTYGDLKKVMKAIELKQKGVSIVSRGKEVALDTLLSLIPGASTAKTVLGFVQAAMNRPDDKKTNTWLDKLDIDDKIAQIVDDTVESRFMKYISNRISSKSDDMELEDDFNMNNELQKWLSSTFNKRTVTYVKEQLLREVIRAEIRKQKLLI